MQPPPVGEIDSEKNSDSQRAWQVIGAAHAIWGKDDRLIRKYGIRGLADSVRIYVQPDSAIYCDFWFLDDLPIL